jgi:CBS domain-containing protein
VQPPHETLAETVAFLERHPPFDGLGSDALATLAASAELEYFPAGTEILRQEGAPSSHLYVVRRGAVDLVDQGSVIDVLEEGESVGHPSLLTGSPAVFTARAREDSLCYRFPADAAFAALSQPAGVRFVAASLGRRLARATDRSRRGAPWLSAPVGTASRPPLVCSPETPIRDIAARMTERDVDDAVVQLDGGFALVTDRDLRRRVVTGEIGAEAPVSALVERPALVVREDRLALDVLVDMLGADDDRAVVLDAGGALVGVLDRSALLDLEAPSPLLVRREIENAADIEGLARAVAGLPELAVRLLDAHVGAHEVLLFVL